MLWSARAELVDGGVVQAGRDRGVRWAEFGKSSPGVISAWERAWEQFIPFLAFDREIRRVRPLPGLWQLGPKPPERILVADPTAWI